MRFLLLPASFLLTCSAQDAIAPKPEDWRIRIELTAVIVPEKLALAVMADANDPAKLAAAFAKVEAAVASGEASLAGRQTVNTRHAARAVAEAVEEIKYGVEFERPKFPALDSKKDISSLPAELERVEFPATTFETRNAGLTLEVTPAVSADGQWLRLTAASGHVRLLKWDEFDVGVTPKGVRLSIKQPRFFAATNSGELFVRSGERALAGSHKFPDQPKTWELFFIKATTARKPEAVK